MKKPWKWIVIVLVVGGLGTGALMYFKGGNGKQMAQAAMTEAKAERRDFSLNVLATGTVKPKVGAQVNVGARQSGKVEKLLVKIGDQVKKDQIIAMIEHQDLDANLAQAEAELKATKVQLSAKKLMRVADKAKMEAQIAQRRLEVATERVRLESIRTQLTTELELARRQLSSTKAQRSAEVGVAAAEIQERAASQALAEKDIKRYTELFQKGMLAEQSLDQAKADAEAAQSRLRSAQQSKKLAHTKLAHEVALQEESVKKAEEDLAREVALQEEAVKKAESNLDVTLKEYEAQETSYQAEIDIMEANIPKLETELELTKIRLSYATVRAPIGGTVGTISTQEGETVAAGFSAPTFVTVVNLGMLQVDAYVDEVDVGKVKEGQKATFQVDAYPDVEFKGTVTAIYPTAVLRDNVIYYDVVVDIEGEFAGKLRPEMTANVTIKADSHLGVLGIPAKALDRKAGTNLVHVKKADGSTESREVALGLEDEEFVEVTKGLEEGEVVVYKASTQAKAE